MSESAHDKYGEAVATLHNTRLRSSGTLVAIGPEDLARGVLNISGLAEAVTEGVWRVGGVEVRVDERTLGWQELKPDLTAKAVVARGANGRLHALNLSTTDAGLPESGTFVSGAVGQVTDNEIVVGGQRMRITPETLLKLKPEEGQRVQVTVNNGAAGAVASAVERAHTEAGVTDAPTLAYEGTIEGNASTENQTNEWAISGQPFVISPATVVDAQGGNVRSGARARVEAVSRGGQLLAQRVVILATDAAPTSVHLTGVFQGSSGGLWLVSGLAVEPTGGVEALTVGSLVAIKAERQEGRIVGRQATVLEPPGQKELARLEGLIAAIEGDIWTIGFAQVHVGKDSKVFGEAIAGARALVWGRQGSDGTLEAAHVRVLDQRPIVPAEQQ